VTAAPKSSLLAWLKFKEPGVVDELSVANLDARIEHAVLRTERIKAFHRRFPPMQTDNEELAPPIGWDQLERQLCSLAGPDFERAGWEMQVLKVSARTNPPEMFYRDLLTLAWSLIDGARPLPPMEDGMD
jgi:hypothetical protein